MNILLIHAAISSFLGCINWNVVYLVVFEVRIFKFAFLKVF